MKNLPTVLLVSVVLSGCAPAKETGEFLAENIKDGIHSTVYALQDWSMKGPDKEGEDKFVEATYCYRVQSDILCYRDLMPGMEQQLVSYQGTDAMPPKQVAMRLLPKSALNSDYLPENRVKNIQPVVEVKMPTEEEKLAAERAGENGEVELTPDMASEVLPDPSKSPQL